MGSSPTSKLTVSDDTEIKIIINNLFKQIEIAVSRTKYLHPDTSVFIIPLKEELHVYPKSVYDEKKDRIRQGLTSLCKYHKWTIVFCADTMTEAIGSVAYVTKC